MSSTTVALVEVEPVVMVVCWEPCLLDTVARFLLISGFRVFTAQSDVEAVSLYNQHQEEIDLVLLNLSMPPDKYGGLAIFDTLRQITPAVRCAFMSADGRQKTAADVIRAGAVGFFLKPFRLDEFVKAMRELTLR
jgi:DNA-binding response OmpR family regulator